MSSSLRSIPAVVALMASLLGLSLSSSSTFDYAAHLDRQMHGIHCSFVPGASEAETQATGCRTAMFSTYSAVFRDKYWGGIPIALFGMGAFAFFAALAIYMLFAGRDAPRKASLFLGTVGLTPGLVSAMMAYISATKLGEYCHTCVGIYISSGLLALAGVLALIFDRREASRAAEPPPPAGSSGLAPTIVDEVVARSPARRPGSFGLLVGWTFGLAAFAAAPPLVYASSVPTYASQIGACGTLAVAPAPDEAIAVETVGAKEPATMFVDPLCPTCKGFHTRLVQEGVLEKLDIKLVLFPLDNTCNWMLDRAVHPGACTVSKAILCAPDKAMTVLEWAYEHQDEILETAKSEGGEPKVRDLIHTRFGDLDACIVSKDTDRKLDKMLRYIVKNQLPVSTPQLFLGERRLCDEDTDIGFAYTIRKLAPGVATP